MLMYWELVLVGVAILSVAYVCSSDDWAAFQMFLDATLNPVLLVSNELEPLSLTSSRKEEVRSNCSWNWYWFFLQDILHDLNDIKKGKTRTKKNRLYRTCFVIKCCSCCSCSEFAETTEGPADTWIYCQVVVFRLLLYVHRWRLYW